MMKMTDTEKLDIINKIVNKYYEYDMSLDDNDSYVKGYLESILESISLISTYSYSEEDKTKKKVLNE